MINVIIPCAGGGSRLNLPYSKEIHRIGRNTSLIDLSLNFCLQNKKIIKKIIIVTKPEKKDLISYLSKWKKNFQIKICYFNNNYYEWAGSVLSAKKFFGKKNVVLLPDTIIEEYKNKNLFKLMNSNLNESDVCFALKKESDKNKISNLGALFVEKNKIVDFCDKPKKNFKNYNCFWCSFGFNKKFSSKLLFMMMSSIQRKKVNILEEKFETSFFYIKDFLDLGTWKDLKHKKIFFNEH